LRSPLMGVDGTETSKTWAQQRAAGTKKTALFDIVNRNDAATHSVPTERAPRRVSPEPCTQTRAMRRAGPPVASFTFANPPASVAPEGGTLSRLATFSKPQRPEGSQA